ncbi:MAG: 3-oxoacyl-ACP synthase III [Phycisphaerales bacterium]|nr:3-oxoacyl-ACP synthase III [Phycisphaerales bacterium]
MRFNRVALAGIAYELPPNVVESSALDDRLAPVYAALGLGPRQIEPLTGVRERRFWNPGQPMAEAAGRAANQLINRLDFDPARIGAVVYAGVCRDQIEPATACAVADAIGVAPRAFVYDVSNACLGAMNAALQIASAIELGQIQAGLVVCAETARQIVDLTIDRMLARRDMETFKTSLATMTGGSGAIAMLLVNDDLAREGASRILGGVARQETRHHRLCRWGPDTGHPASAPMVMETHAVAVMENGVRLGVETWRDLLAEMEWSANPDRVVCHQVGAANRDAVLKALRVDPATDYSTFPFLGNIGTVSLPITAAIAAERGHLETGHSVAFLGIGSGLNCVMLGVNWGRL